MFGTMVTYVDSHNVAKPAIITATNDTMPEAVDENWTKPVPACLPGHVHVTVFSPSGSVRARFNVTQSPDGAYRNDSELANGWPVPATDTSDSDATDAGAPASDATDAPASITDLA